jgi:leucyl aminopeptidase
MELKLVRSSASHLDADAVVVIEFERSTRTEFAKPLAALYASGEIRGKRREFTLVHGLEGYKARRVLIGGAGKREKFDAAELRKLAGAAVRFLDGKGIATLAFVLDDDLTAHSPSLRGARTPPSTPRSKRAVLSPKRPTCPAISPSSHPICSLR